MAKTALIVWGGWDGHEPEKVARFFEQILIGEGFEVQVADSLDAFADEENVLSRSLLIPVYTMSEISNAQREPIFKAVKDYGVGIAGCHGGMCDSFRTDTEWAVYDRWAVGVSPR